MPSNAVRTIKRGDDGITVELRTDGSMNDFVECSEVMFLANGWIECNDPDGENRTRFVPPNRVVRVDVEDDDPSDVT